MELAKFTVQFTKFRTMHYEPNTPEAAEGIDDPDWMDHWHFEKEVEGYRCLMTKHNPSDPAKDERRLLQGPFDDVSEDALTKLVDAAMREIRFKIPVGT